MKIGDHTYQKVYFLGIGGIGMSALARYCLARGLKVYGYDKTANRMVNSLREEGAIITLDEGISGIPLGMSKEDTLVVYTPALPKNHKQLDFFKSLDFNIIKRSEFLGRISETHYTLAVAGTHGKTTTSTMLAYLMHAGNKDPWAFLGGIAANFNSNYLEGKSAYMVTEADEFDRSFLTLHPQVSAITSTDADHLDVYADEEKFKEGFKAFADQAKNGGGIVISEASAGIESDFLYGGDDSFYRLSETKIESGNQIFTAWAGTSSTPVELSMPGKHNALNALAAMAIAHQSGMDWRDLGPLFKGFKGVYRRFEQHVRGDDFGYIDDYAHHPTEIRAAVQGARELYPKAKLLVIFQPHLFSRTKDFMEGFADALSLADETWILPIYPAREAPISGVISEAVLGKMSLKNAQVLNPDLVLKKLRDGQDNQVVMTLGAGDIDQIVEEVASILSEKWA